MKVILLKPVPKLGKPEDVVEVNEGFARNSLFPQKKAIPATESALGTLARTKNNRIAEKAVQQTLLDKAIKEIMGASVALSAPANDKGVLFSKITAKEISAYLLKEHRISIAADCLILPQEGIKHTGVYTIEVKDGSYTASFDFTIKANK